MTTRFDALSRLSWVRHGRQFRPLKLRPLTLILAFGWLVSGCAEQQPQGELPDERPAKTRGELLAGIVAAYGLDEGAGATFRDASGNGNNGMLDGQTWVPGRFGQALKFTRNSASIADSNVLDLESALTLSAWVKPSSAHDNWPTIAMKEGDGEFAYGLFGEWWDEFDDHRAPSSVLRADGVFHALSGGGARVQRRVVASCFYLRWGRITGCT